jgi:hypothetical protein
MRSGGLLLLPVLALWRREMTRFLRQRNRIIGALATPLVFWLLIGSGLGESFAAPGVEGGFMRYFFPRMKDRRKFHRIKNEYVTDMKFDLTRGTIERATLKCMNR